MGAGFGRALTDSGASAAIVALAGQWHVPILLLAWFIAALIRTVTMVPFILTSKYPPFGKCSECLKRRKPTIPSRRRSRPPLPAGSTLR
ncbi:MULTISPECIES: hypothetical protein [unclassified Sphingomonas]|uniref:hypothetical protein n=1 Tax=unclassified Sphingomonas TaxID=196159 RepID=UPI0035931EF8